MYEGYRWLQHFHVYTSRIQTWTAKFPPDIKRATNHFALSLKKEEAFVKPWRGLSDLFYVRAVWGATLPMILL